MGRTNKRSDCQLASYSILGRSPVHQDDATHSSCAHRELHEHCRNAVSMADLSRPDELLDVHSVVARLDARLGGWRYGDVMVRTLA